jgi:AP-2 complex subunit beta-1
VYIIISLFTSQLYHLRSRYASEVDIDFVRKAVRSIGRLAIKVESASDSCIQALLNLIEHKVSYVVQEAVIVIKDIFRRYPGKYEGIIPTMCSNLDLLDEAESKAAMVWIIGQFANIIDNADEILDDLCYTFLEENVEVCKMNSLRHHNHRFCQVQLALLTATVKLFVYKPKSDKARELVFKVLKSTTEEVDNPDLRDRGFMYWRMIAVDPALAAEIVLAEKPPITTDSDRMDRGALDQLLLHTGTLGSIYHKNPEVCTHFCYPLDEFDTYLDLDFHQKCSRKSAKRQSRAECSFSRSARSPDSRTTA